jgi:hypothetical protein
MAEGVHMLAILVSLAYEALLHRSLAFPTADDRIIHDTAH